MERLTHKMDNLSILASCYATEKVFEIVDSLENISNNIKSSNGKKPNNQQADLKPTTNYRTVPPRACKRDLKIHPAIMKASINSKVSSSEEIRKLYTNNCMGNFQPSSLETIFEDPQPMPKKNEFRFIGVKKILRKIVFTPATAWDKDKLKVKKWRSKVIKHFGERKPLKNIAKKRVVDHLKNSNISDENDDEQSTYFKSSDISKDQQ